MHISVRGIVEKDDGIILIHRIKPKEDGTLRDYYLVPGGKQEEGENNLDTLNFYTDIFCNIYPVELKSLPFYCNNSNYIL